MAKGASGVNGKADGAGETKENGEVPAGEELSKEDLMDGLMAKIEDADIDEDADQKESTKEGALDAAGNETTEGLEQKKKQSRSEKKARKALLKLGLRPVQDVFRVAIKQPKDIIFVISDPDIFKSPTSDTYVVFGEPKMEDLGSKAVAKAAEQFKADTDLDGVGKSAQEGPPSLLPGESVGVSNKFERNPDDVFRAEGINQADVKLIMAQTQCTQEKAIQALKNKKGDLLTAILELSEAN